MKKIYIIGIVIVLVLIVLWGFSTYNGLVTSNEAVAGQWAQVETQYERRFALIPNLVSVAQGVMKQEQAIFNNLADARSRYSGAQSVDDKVRAAGEVEGALARLLVVVENYPQLKSSENMQILMSQLEGTENRVSVERMRFNDTVQNYNLKTKRFPSSIVASIAGFDERPYFEATEAAAQAPQVKFE